MKHTSSLLLICVLLAGAVPVSSQTGTWKTLTNMQNVRDIAVGDDATTIAATSGGIFFKEGVMHIGATNVDGLSDIDYTAVAFLSDGRIVAGASTGYINISTTSGTWLEVSDITRATQITRRGITCIRELDGKLYIGTEFGLAVYDPDRQEFGDTYMKFGDLGAQTRVNDILFSGNQIWVATDDGVAQADLRTPNLKDPANWTSYSTIAGINDAKVFSLASFGGLIVAAGASAISSFDAGVWTLYASGFGVGSLRKIIADGSRLLVLTEFGLFGLDQSGQATPIGDRLDNGSYLESPKFTDVEMADGVITVASTAGVATLVTGAAWSFGFPNGPGSNFFKSFAVDDDGILWASSGLAEGGNGMYSFDGTRWRNYNYRTNPEIMSNTVMDVTRGPNGSAWFATRGGGVVEHRGNGSFYQYGPGTVPNFPGINPDPSYAAVEGVQGDSRGNVWSLHELSNAGILGCRTADSSWYFFSDPSLPSGLRTKALTVDQYGRAWVILIDAFHGLLVFDGKGTPANPTDDTWTRFLAKDASGINATNDVTAITVDLLGDIWIGTDRGLRTIFNPLNSDHVSKTCFNTRCNIEGLFISSIAIDPVNNKWLGTKDGVFVLSPDGSEIIAQYTAENSKLLDNEIMDILVHPTTGVAYIATRRGLSSLSTPFVEPTQVFGELRVSPNPFRPGIDDRLLIDGLVEASIIKILSVSGDLIAEVPSPGGRIGFWDGRTSDGSFAASGVYFVVAAASNGKQAGVTKVAVVRR